jgi:uncharacterized membrane protein YedE/YeeE
MAATKTIRILILVLALCGGLVGVFVGIKLSHRLQLSANLQVALVILGAAGCFGIVWFFYWVSQNLFVEENEKPR